MNIAQTKRILEKDKMPGTTFSGFKNVAGLHIGIGATPGNSVENWAPGALFIDNNSATIKSNSGNATTAVWTAIILAEQTYTGTEDALKITTSNVAGTCLELICAASATDSMLKVDGSTGNWIGATGVGMVNLVCDGALADANASCLLITYSGAGAATGLGTSLRIVDTGATATSWAAYISAATGEALYVAVGIAKFAESVTLDTGLTFSTSGAILSESATVTSFNAGAANETFEFGNTTATDVLFNGANATVDMLWDSSLDALNIGVAAAVTRSVTSGKGVINLFNANAAPAGTLANGVTLYVEGGLLKALSAAGNITVLTAT